MKKTEIKKAMSELAKFRWSKTSRKERIAYAQKMVKAKKDKRAKNEVS